MFLDYNICLISIWTVTPANSSPHYSQKCCARQCASWDENTALDFITCSNIQLLTILLFKCAKEYHCRIPVWDLRLLSWPVLGIGNLKRLGRLLFTYEAMFSLTICTVGIRNLFFSEVKWRDDRGGKIGCKRWQHTSNCRYGAAESEDCLQWQSFASCQGW